MTNPADLSPICSVAALGTAETARAVAAAEAALPAWRAKTAKERSALLRKWFELMMANQEDLARLLSWEQGKPLAESRGEIAYGASFIEWFAEEAKRVYGDVIPHDKQGRRLVVIKQPIGVAAAITPWNFPNAMITRKAGPALAAGCTIVIKPASETPLSALALAELASRAGIPAGVVNVVTGDARAIGGELTRNPVVRKLSFTGSTGIGKLLMAQCADTMKKVSMELGGNAPFIVFDDADLDAAVAGAMASKYRNSGQTCVCTNRILVQDGVYDEFAKRLVAAVNALKVAPAHEAGAEQGPLINAKAVLKIQEHIDDAVAKGAKVLAGGKPHALGGSFFEPTVLGERDPGDAGGARRDLRPAGADLPLQDRGRSHRHGQRHRVRPGLLPVHPRPGPRLARQRGAGIRHGGGQRGYHLHRDRPVRRHQGVRYRPRRFEVRHRRLPGTEVHVSGHRQLNAASPAVLKHDATPTGVASCVFVEMKSPIHAQARYRSRPWPCCRPAKRR